MENKDRQSIVRNFTYEIRQGTAQDHFVVPLQAYPRKRTYIYVTNVMKHWCDKHSYWHSFAIQSPDIEQNDVFVTPDGSMPIVAYLGTKLSGVQNPILIGDFEIVEPRKIRLKLVSRDAFKSDLYRHATQQWNWRGRAAVTVTITVEIGPQKDVEEGE